uniref:4-hydroxyphenylpyruvate dioxygenase n=1 Tax=Haptolina ericina TaxID=156174 RepID=A0A7S3F2D2_9EUKA
MGNTSGMTTTDPAEALTDQSQVFLPTNNALSPVGHVHWYLEELGQGIQHVASRVASLPDHVQRANNYRELTGEGFTFLNIPRTYYGVLDRSLLMRGGADGELLGASATGLTEREADDVISALTAASLVDMAGAVDLDATDEDLKSALATASCFAGASDETKALVLRVVRRSRIINLWRLMGDQLSEATYLSIVRNKILVDIQGEDVLMQIFTTSMLQRKEGTQAPFLEFIQRVCAEAPDGSASSTPIRPGCGGFGIRNFLTLFLSIEVSKAMADQKNAEAKGAAAEASFHSRRVQLFTDQLVESNPILTEVSDCMTGEGKALERGDKEAAVAFAARKDAANSKLQACSAKYNTLMKEMREKGWA